MSSLEVTLEVARAPSATLVVGDPTAHTFGADEYVPMRPVIDEYEGPYVVAPDETTQTLTTDGLLMDDDVTVAAIAPDYVGSAIDRRDGSDLSVSGATVSVPSGYYESATSASVQTGAAPTVQAPTIDMATGEVRAQTSLGAGYQAGGTYTSAALALDTQAGATITPTTSEQTAVPQYRWTTGEVKVAAIPPEYVVPSGTYTVNGSGTHDVTSYASASVAAATPTNDSDSEYITSSGVRKWRYRPKTIVPTAGWAAQRSASNPINGFWQTFDAVPTGTTVTPSTSSQTIGGANVMMEGAVTVAAMPSGSTTMPASATGTGTIVGALNNTMNVQGTITATPQVSAGYVSAGTSGSTSVSLQTSVTTLNATTYNPQSSDREIAAGTYLIGKQTIKGAPLQSKSVTTNGSVTPDSGYYGLSDVTVNVSGGAPNLQAKTGITPGTSSQTVTADVGYDGLSSVQIDAVPTAVPFVSIENAEFYTDSFNRRRWRFTPFVEVDESQGDTAGYIADGSHIQGENCEQAAVPSGTTVTPTESQQTIGGAGQMLEGAVTVSAISSTYVGSGVTQRSSSDLSASGATVTAPSGYYASSATKTVSSGTARPASAISSSGATLSTGTNTIILTKSVSNVPDVTAGYISSGTSGNTSVTLQATATLKGATTYHPSTSNQTISGSTYLTGAQTINAVTVTNLDAGNIKNGVTVKIGDASDDDCVTSVTGTYTGGGGGSSMNVQVAQSTSRATSSTYTSVVSLTCSTAGTYDVYWDCFRSTTGGTSGSQLYIGGNAYGTANTTFTNHAQTNHLTGVTLAANQTVAVYARSRGSNYYAYVGTLVIKQTA